MSDRDVDELIRTLQSAITHSDYGDVHLHVGTASEIKTVLEDYKKAIKIADDTLKLLEKVNVK